MVMTCTQGVNSGKLPVGIALVIHETNGSESSNSVSFAAGVNGIWLTCCANAAAITMMNTAPAGTVTS